MQGGHNGHSLVLTDSGASIGPALGHEVAVARSKMLVQELKRRVHEAEVAAVASTKERDELARWERIDAESTIRHRAKNLLEVARTGEDHSSRIEGIVMRLEEAFNRVQQQRLLLIPQHKVCQKRMEIRERRPYAEKERERDRASEALEAEMQVIQASKTSFLAWEQEAQQLLADLVELQGDLSRDATARRLQAEADKASLFAGRLNVEPDAQMANIQEMLVRATGLQEHAEGHTKTANAIIVRSRQEVGRAASWVDQALVQCMSHAEGAARQLRLQSQEIEDTINDAEMSLLKSRRKIDSRDRRRVFNYECGCQKLDELRESRKELARELQMKLSVITIDSTCRKLAPRTLEPRLISSSATASPASQRRRPASASLIGRRAGSVPAFNWGIDSRSHRPDSKGSSPSALLSPPVARRLDMEDAGASYSTAASTVSVAGSPARAVQHLSVVSGSTTAALA